MHRRAQALASSSNAALSRSTSAALSPAVLNSRSFKSSFKTTTVSLDGSPSTGVRLEDFVVVFVDFLDGSGSTERRELRRVFGSAAGASIFSRSGDTDRRELRLGGGGAATVPSAAFCDFDFGGSGISTSITLTFVATLAAA